ncbi:unnamed protein product [Cylicostephanus goldi]|uniref:Histone H2A n=1 Tax=Cylicostephanus goldi TaxID=71465 RepID=A0A3P7PP29_CYLGO|nr:unnamed protein product [Cylicostephanus goldi]
MASYERRRRRVHIELLPESAMEDARRSPALMGKHANDIGDGAIYLAAILDYLAALVLDRASNVAYEFKTRVDLRQLQLIVCNDEELNRLMSQVLKVLVRRIPRSSQEDDF